MKKRLIYISIAVGLVVLIWGGYRTYCASQNLVTLDVRDADVRKVIRSIEWQTWEIILTHKDVAGKVTFKVDNAPLEAVLEIISDQLDIRWSTVYPLYSSGKSLVAFKQCVRGDLNPRESGWTNLNSRGSGGRGPGGMFGQNVRSENNEVSFNFSNQDLNIATMAFSRFAQTQIVPEDGTDGKVNLQLDRVPLSKAVARVAKQVSRKWDCFYTLQTGFRMGRGDDRDRGGEDRQDRRRDRGEGEPPAVAMSTNAPASTNQTNQVGPPMMAGGPSFTGSRQNSEQMNQLMETLPAQQRQQMEQERQRMEEFRQMPQEQREQAMRSGGGPGGGGPGRGMGGMDNRMRSRILNTTPDQRVDRVRHFKEMQSRFQQRQQQPTR